MSGRARTQDLGPASPVPSLWICKLILNGQTQQHHHSSPTPKNQALIHELMEADTFSKLEDSLQG